MKTKSNLARILDIGQFAVTVEISPPQNTQFETIRRNVNLIKGYVDAFNVPDGQAAVVAMASWAVCLVGMEEGLDAVVHMTCRDRNRIALQMDILAVSAFGVNNILCLSGDPIYFGNHPKAKPVFDLDSIQLVRMVKQLRDEKKFDNGELIVGTEPRLFIGAAINPFVQPLEAAVDRLKDKVTAGADFVQTQPIYNIEGFKKWMELVREKGLHKDVKIIAGITPITSLAAARYMKTKVPNMDIPDRIIERLKNVRNKDEAAEEGIEIAVETINQLKQIEGVAGVHIMTLQREELIPKICNAANLYPRP
ncbi:MAG: methylenetetrahydrofolate reductase [Dehalococcoidia bacterium]|nr:methylenetetrahydrofolate reductase [Dehalococcoidia bacterium]